MTRRRACVPPPGVGDRFRGSAGPVDDDARGDAVDEQRELRAERLGVAQPGLAGAPGQLGRAATPSRARRRRGPARAP